MPKGVGQRPQSPASHPFSRKGTRSTLAKRASSRFRMNGSPGMNTWKTSLGSLALLVAGVGLAVGVTTMTPGHSDPAGPPAPTTSLDPNDAPECPPGHLPSRATWRPPPQDAPTSDCRVQETGRTVRPKPPGSVVEPAPSPSRREDPPAPSPSEKADPAGAADDPNGMPACPPDDGRNADTWAPPPPTAGTSDCKVSETGQDDRGKPSGSTVEPSP